MSTNRVAHGDVDVSIGQWFARRCARTPARRALTFEGRTWTYAELLDQADRLASHLLEHGVCGGDRVSFLGLNQPAYFHTLFAASRIGAIFVPLNFRLAAPELAFILGDAGVHTLVCDAEHCGLIDGVVGELPLRHRLRVEGADGGWAGLLEAIATADPLCGSPPIAPDEVALIMYTSGTTGRPKGAMLTHANLWWNNANALHQWDVLEDDVTLAVAPLFHIGGLNAGPLVTLQKGGEVVLHRSFDPGIWLRDVRRHRVNTTFGVPAMLMAISRHPDFPSAELDSVRTIFAGGAPVPAELLRLYSDRGITVLQGFGLTETAPLVSFLSGEFALAKLGSAGVPPLFTDLKIVDTEGRPVEQPEVVGELCVRGPNVMKGYWNRPEATARAIDEGGWFHTGDVGYLDADGFLYIVDRLKDMIITGGENVYAAEVENVLFAHPAVAEVAVIGAPDERWGEVVVAVVVAETDAELSLDGLREFACERLARYKLPTRLELVAELPRNASGKVLKHELRTRLRHPADEVASV